MICWKLSNQSIITTLTTTTLTNTHKKCDHVHIFTRKSKLLQDESTWRVEVDATFSNCSIMEFCKSTFNTSSQTATNTLTTTLTTTNTGYWENCLKSCHVSDANLHGQIVNYSNSLTDKFTPITHITFTFYSSDNYSYDTKNDIEHDVLSINTLISGTNQQQFEIYRYHNHPPSSSSSLNCNHTIHIDNVDSVLLIIPTSFKPLNTYTLPLHSVHSVQITQSLNMNQVFHPILQVTISPLPLQHHHLDYHKQPDEIFMKWVLPPFAYIDIYQLRNIHSLNNNNSFENNILKWKLYANVELEASVSSDSAQSSLLLLSINATVLQNGDSFMFDLPFHLRYLPAQRGHITHKHKHGHEVNKKGYDTLKLDGLELVDSKDLFYFPIDFSSQFKFLLKHDKDVRDMEETDKWKVRRIFNSITTNSIPDSFDILFPVAQISDTEYVVVQVGTILSTFISAVLILYFILFSSFHLHKTRLSKH